MPRCGALLVLEDHGGENVSRRHTVASPCFANSGARCGELARNGNTVLTIGFIEDELDISEVEEASGDGILAFVEGLLGTEDELSKLTLKLGRMLSEPAEFRLATDPID